MITTNITNFRKDMFNLIDQTIRYNEPVLINAKNGKAVVLSEEDYNNIMETIYLTSVPGMEKTISDGLKVEVKDCLSENEVEW